MTIWFSAPSKTFLVGEYAVLNGGSSLILNSLPRFAIKVETGAHRVVGIPNGSPASRWVEQHRALLENWQLDFSDPHGGRGGFGASSAQFLFVHGLTTFLQSSVSQAAAGLDLKVLWQDFQAVTGGHGSGCDLLAQAVGGIARVDRRDLRVQPLTWPYDDIEFAVVRTGQKVATHDHLANLKLESVASLVEPANACVESFVAETAEVFLATIKDFAKHLQTLGLCAPTTASLLEALNAQSWCLASKGCGAMGADTVVFFYHPEMRASAQTFCVEHGLEMVVSRAEISPGLDMNWSSN